MTSREAASAGDLAQQPIASSMVEAEPSPVDGFAAREGQTASEDGLSDALLASLRVESARPVQGERRATLPTLTIPKLDLDDRIGRLLLSMLLAVLLWVYVASLENPAQTTSFNGLTVDVRGVAPNLKLISPNPLPTINTIVQAPQNVMANLKPSDIRPFIDLSNVPAGTLNVPIRAEVNGVAPGGADVSLSPQTVQVQLEVQVTRPYTVVVQVNGTPAFGYGAEPSQATPNQVEVTGATNAVERIAQVVVPIDVEGKAVTQKGVTPLRALDSSGTEIVGLTFNPASIEAVVPIKLLLNYKPVRVTVPLIGQAAPGYQVLAIDRDPTIVTVCCSSSVGDSLEELETVPVAITGSTSIIVTTTQLILPSGVTLLPGQSSSVKVTVSFEQIVTRLQISTVPTITGLTAGRGAIVSPESIELIVSGTFEQLQSLRPNDVQANVDVQGRGPGTYELQPQITLPAGVKLEGSTPQRVTVTIVAPTPVPPTVTPTVPPTLTPQPLPTSTQTPVPPVESSPTPPTPSVIVVGAATPTATRTITPTTTTLAPTPIATLPTLATPTNSPFSTATAIATPTQPPTPTSAVGTPQPSATPPNAP